MDVLHWPLRRRLRDLGSETVGVEQLHRGFQYRRAAGTQLVIGPVAP
jgi:hypothetical protein